jgi:hypothetical protein
LLKEAEQGGVKVLWVPVRGSAYMQTPLKNYQTILDPSKPLAILPKAKRDQAWVKICEEIQKAASQSGREPPPEHELPPEIGASFVLDGGAPKSKKLTPKGHVHYKIRLYVRNAPSETYAVTYKLHPTFPNPIREVQKSPKSPQFSHDIFSCGDFDITAEVRTSSRRYEINRRLSDALKAERDSPSPLERQALKEICEN